MVKLFLIRFIRASGGPPNGEGLARLCASMLLSFIGLTFMMNQVHKKGVLVIKSTYEQNMG